MAERKKWQDRNKSEKIIATSALALMAVIVIVFAVATNKSASSNNDLAKKTMTAIENLDTETRQTIASTGAGGMQGSILSVEPASGSGSVKVSVTTQFEESGDGQNGGRNIARNIFNAICAKVPDLESVYVVSTGSGLESRSFYRSESVCN